MIRSTDLTVFYNAVVGGIKYTSSNSSINAVEDFLMNWLNGLDYENSENHINQLYEMFINDFAYDGILYRGIALNKGIELKSNYLTSFTSDITVAEEFAATYGQELDSMLFTTKAKAFDLEKLLNVIRQKTDNVDLDIVIEDRIWEQEKLHIFNLNDVKLVS